ncbi:MAG: glycosyltransferase family 4 protein [Acidobacteriota bacterium]
MITDTWVKPGNLLGAVRRGLRGRFHPDLAKANVQAANFDNIAFELSARVRGLQNWPLMTARNDWFQRKVVSWLSGNQPATLNEQPVVFAYSYAARHVFRFARERGHRTVLGQIDPGPVEERIVAKLWAEHSPQQERWQPTPPGYWESWREECALADTILVNSEWSRRALVQEGIPAEKLRLIPLAYEPQAEAATFQREYPQAFTHERPLRVLFLGLVNLRKGMGPVLDALRQLRGEPMEFEFVGPLQIHVPEDLRQRADIHWRGAVPRSQVARYYQHADVFLFPTMSDGFGLTQLEAQAWKLPVIASRFCGEVIEDGHNGWVLSKLSADSIADALRRCAAEPSRLREFAENAVPRERFSLARFGEQLLNIFN